MDVALDGEALIGEAYLRIDAFDIGKVAKRQSSSVKQHVSLIWTPSQ
jgi:hypothetical protein